MSHMYDYIEAGFRVFGIHGAGKDGNCECGNPNCQAPYKHPRISNWQRVPAWSDEQIETFEALGHFRTGFGVLCTGWLIVDVDARNGGVESFRKLCEDIPAAGQSAFVVDTGSGGGSQHHYFSLPEAAAMLQHHHKYPGIDFKTSGYVIGAGSMHASGAQYEVARGFPQDITDAPQGLIGLLRKPDRHRVDYDGGAVDVSDDDVSGLLSHIDPDMGYEEWIKVGMAVHHCTGGLGLELWDAWSAKGSKYPGVDVLERHWHSFGKSDNPAGFGTLMLYARQGGYVDDVTFEYQSAEVDNNPNALDDTAIDLLRPPGFVGDLCQWINDQCLYPRERLAVAASLMSISSLAGMRYVDELDGITPNVMAFCVAGASSGKESVIQAYLEIMRAAGIQGAVHGEIKSEQEIYRNLVRHQAAYYMLDELGIKLQKLENARSKGSTPYLEGVIGTIMSVYSKASGFLPITGDQKEELREKLQKDLARVEKRKDDLPADSGSDIKRERLERESDRLSEALRTVDDGLDSPYLCIMGMTTPVTFDQLVTREQATNGFMARAMIFRELETNPKRKRGFSKRRMDDSFRGALQALWAPGEYDMLDTVERVECRGEKTPVPTTAEAAALMDDVYEQFFELAEQHKGATGMEAIPRRGYEIAAKVSLLLAIPGGVRTAEHVRWAYALARQDAELKIKMAYATDEGGSDNGLAARVLSIVSKDHGETKGVIVNRMRPTPRAQVESLLALMVGKGMLKEVEGVGGNHKVVTRYYAC